MKSLLFLIFISLSSIAMSQSEEDLQKLSKEELIKKYRELQRKNQQSTEEDFGFGQIFKQMNKSLKNLLNDPFLRGLEDDDLGVFGMDSDLKMHQYEKDGKYIVEIDTTNIDQESLKININNGIISISGKTKIEEKKQQTNGQSFMQFESTFSKSFPVPQNADEEKVDIINEKGAVKIIFPMKRQGKMI